MTTIRAATAMRVLEAIDRAGIGHAVVRNHEQIPTDPGRDVDLLAPQRSLPEIEIILGRAREEFGWDTVVRCAGHHEGTSYYFIGPPTESGRPEQLEIHFTRIRWAGATILGPDDLIARRIRSESGIWVAAPEHTVVQRVLQIGLSDGFGRMKEAYWDELTKLVGDHEEAVEDALDDVVDDRALARQCVETIVGGDRAGLTALSPSLRRRFLLAGGGISRLRDLPAIARAALGKALGTRYPARCGVVARVEPSTPDSVIEHLERDVGHMFLECRVVDHAEIGTDRVIAEAAEVVARAGLLVVRAPEPFDSAFRWVPRVACWIPPDDPRTGVDVIVRRFVANHVFVRP